MAKMGIGHLITLNHIANNYQERCYLACSYLAIQISLIASIIGLSRWLQEGFVLDRKISGLGLQPPGGSQGAFLTGLAHLYNLIPYQRRALNAGLCGVEVEGGRVPTADWMLNLQILTSGGYRPAGMGTTT